MLQVSRSVGSLSFMALKAFNIRAALIGLAFTASACATTPAATPPVVTPPPVDQPPPAAQTFPPGSLYVAMGSSFASGPGVTHAAEGSPQRCGRSNDNYAHQLSRMRQMLLVDVTCGGATTRFLLGPWEELPAQLDAVSADTRLVTITIGGNDLGYMSGLFRASCAQPPCQAVVAPSEQAYSELAARMDQIVSTIRARAPEARIVFVDYPHVLPAQGICAATPMTEADANMAREIARRLIAITAEVAARNNTDLLQASRLSENHDACATEAWMNGSTNPNPLDGVAYHLKRAGMTAIADALHATLPR
jgi:lysophospholipase L1-like esterase